MKVEILTLFPDIFSGFTGASLIKKNIDSGILDLNITNFRNFAKPPHYKVDDEPYGGGAGMVLKPEPLINAIRQSKEKLPEALTICLTPSGTPLSQEIAQELSSKKELILICGRYEGFDQRIIDLEVDMELSIGDYVLMGGEIPAMVLIEATTRLLQGAIGNELSTEHESFTTNRLEAPQFTRPRSFEGVSVPETLLSGNHQKIHEWREAASFRKTKLVRPDLLENK